MSLAMKKLSKCTLKLVKHTYIGTREIIRLVLFFKKVFLNFFLDVLLPAKNIKKTFFLGNIFDRDGHFMLFFLQSAYICLTS